MTIWFLNKFVLKNLFWSCLQHELETQTPLIYTFKLLVKVDGVAVTKDKEEVLLSISDGEY